MMICLLTLPRGPALEPDEAEDAHLPTTTSFSEDHDRPSTTRDGLEAPRRCGYGDADEGRRP
jgi:hypothetical protein